MIISKNEILNYSFDNFLKEEYEDKILEIKRITKVVKGGKKFRFRAVVATGDLKEKVGLGIGKSEDTNIAIEKAIINARKNIIFVPITAQKSISSFVNIKYGSSHIILKPAKLGTGIKAGSSIRSILELSGIKNIVTKRFGSKNLLNNAKLTILALNSLIIQRGLIKKRIFNNKNII